VKKLSKTAGNFGVHQVLEIRPSIMWDKGKALEFLLESLGTCIATMQPTDFPPALFFRISPLARARAISSCLRPCVVHSRFRLQFLYSVLAYHTPCCMPKNKWQLMDGWMDGWNAAYVSAVSL
jgi:hypothetical protein